jgi:hypothetical protein
MGSQKSALANLVSTRPSLADMKRERKKERKKAKDTERSTDIRDRNNQTFKKEGIIPRSQRRSKDGRSNRLRFAILVNFPRAQNNNKSKQETPIPMPMVPILWVPKKVQ